MFGTVKPVLVDFVKVDKIIRSDLVGRARLNGDGSIFQPIRSSQEESFLHANRASVRFIAPASPSTTAFTRLILNLLQDLSQEPPGVVRTASTAPPMLAIDVLKTLCAVENKLPSPLPSVI
jgi:hypothetical protein